MCAEGGEGADGCEHVDGAGVPVGLKWSGDVGGGPVRAVLVSLVSGGEEVEPPSKDALFDLGVGLCHGVVGVEFALKREEVV